MPSHAAPSPSRPHSNAAASTFPPFLPLTLHVIGTGSAIMGASLFAVAGLMFGLPLAVGTMTGPAVLVGQGMVLVGLFLAGRPTEGSRRYWLARLATALWGTALALDLGRAQVRNWLIANAPSARDLPQATAWASWFVALLLFVCMVHVLVRVLAVRTAWAWLGTALVACQVWLSGWLAVVRPALAWSGASFASRPVLVLPGAAGFFVTGVALVALGRHVHASVEADGAPATTVGNTAKKNPKKSGRRAEPVAETPSNDRVAARSSVAKALPLLGAALTSLSGVTVFLSLLVTLATTLGHSARDVDDTATVGGELVSLVLLLLATHGLRALSPAPLRWSGVALLVLLVGTAVVFGSWTRPFLDASVPVARHASTFFAAAAVAACARCVGHVDDEHVLPRAARELLAKRLRVAWLTFGGMAVASTLRALAVSSRWSMLADVVSLCAASSALAASAKSTSTVSRQFHDASTTRR